MLAYLALGRLLIWLIGFAKPTRWIWQFFEHCDLCMGTWVYTLLGFWFIDVTKDVMKKMGVPYIFGVSQFVVGCIASFVTHVFRLGWEVRFPNANE